MNDEQSASFAHEAYAGLLARAADGALDAVERERLDTHLATCAACREALEDQLAVLQVLRAWEPEPASLGFAQRIRRSATTTTAWIDTWDLRKWTWRLAPVAGALCLAAILVVTRVDASGVADGGPEATPSAGIEPIAAVAFATDDLSERDAVTLLLVADPDGTVSTAFEEMGR